MKKAITLVIFIAMVTLSSCTQDTDEGTNDNFVQNSAKDWFNNTFKKSKEWQQNADSPNKIPDWDKGTYLKKDSLEVFEFPLTEDYAKITVTKNKSLTGKEVTKIMDATLTRLVIIKADTNRMVVRKLYYVPDYKYLESKGYDLSKVVFGNENNDFTGLLITKSWNDEVLSCLKVEEGEIKGMLVKKDEDSNVTARGGFGGDLDEVMIWNGYHKPIDYGYTSPSSQPYVYSPVYPNNPYGLGSSSGGNGDGSGSLVTPNFVLPKEFEKVYPRFTDLVKNIKTFVQNDRCVMEALKLYTGYSESQILDYVTYGKGPEIQLTERTDVYGFFNRTTTGPNVLNISASYVRGLEQAYLPSTQKATAFLLAVTILHESVHYARSAAGLDKIYEYGLGFEREAFGIRIENVNAAEYSIRLQQANNGKINYKCD